VTVIALPMNTASVRRRFKKTPRSGFNRTTSRGHPSGDWNQTGRGRRVCQRLLPRKASTGRGGGGPGDKDTRERCRFGVSKRADATSGGACLQLKERRGQEPRARRWAPHYVGGWLVAGHARHGRFEGVRGEGVRAARACGVAWISPHLPPSHVHAMLLRFAAGVLSPSAIVFAIRQPKPFSHRTRTLSIFHTSSFSTGVCTD
jgi:hypothetical protein